MPLNFKKVGKGSVSTKTPQVPNSNIYAGMMTRNVTEQTYTTSTDGTSISLTPGGRTITGYMPVNGGSPTFSARQPKGMTLRTPQGTQQVHTTPKA